jgi:hypothetical protein
MAQLALWCMLLLCRRWLSGVWTGSLVMVCRVVGVWGHGSHCWTCAVWVHVAASMAVVLLCRRDAGD